MGSKHYYFVCYDICDEQRWRKCHKLIQGYGERVQYSIFKCLLSDKQVAELRWKLIKILTPEDRLLMAPIQPEKVRHLFEFNVPGEWKSAPERFRTL